MSAQLNIDGRSKAEGTLLGVDDATWLGAADREGLEAALVGYFGANAQLHVVGGPVQEGQTSVTYVENMKSGQFFEACLSSTGRWSISPLRRIVTGVNAETADVPDEGLDSIGALTSRDATFDAANCVAASDDKALASLLGQRCAASFPDSLSAYLEGKGVPGVTAHDIMVERKVDQANGLVTFKALAVSGNDRVVMFCTWSDEGEALSVEILG